MWTDEKRAAVIAEYEEQIAEVEEARQPQESLEIVKGIAEVHGETVNGTRLIISRAGVYVKAAPAKKAADKPASTRVNKAEAIQSLRNLIMITCDNDESAVDDDILDKLTGKAAAYFAGVLQHKVGDE